MKTYILILISLISTIGFTQNGINYKALIKDTNGNVIANTPIQIQFTIVQGLTDVYTETHSPTTDNNGIIIVNIGEGTIINGIFNDINWREDDHFLNVQIDTGNGLVDLGTTQFMNVPYAKHAETANIANNVNGLEAINEGNGVGWRLIGKDPGNYGNIGNSAVDLSNSLSNTQDFGAIGYGGFATGIETTALGAGSTAMGSRTVASSSNATAMGSNTTASGIRSTSMGLNSIASGGNSTAMGESTIASGLDATALGNGTQASGDNAMATGRDTEAIGISSTAMGSFTDAIGDFSFAIGDGSSASGETSVAMGNDAFASGQFAVAMGSDTTASNANSTAMGENTTASGLSATSFGGNTTASGAYATVMGLNSNASGIGSTAMGFFTNSESYRSTALGSYNIGFGSAGNWSSTDPLFEIGNGSSNINRSNALTVLKNGNVGIGTHTPQELLHISGGRLRIGTETIEDTGSNQLSIGSSLIPDTNNAFRLGNASNRWIGVWATNGTINTSDRREKKNIRNLKYGLKEVLQMNPVSFNWKNKNNPETKLGLIAQDVLKIVPEVVKTHAWKTKENGDKIKEELDKLGVYYSDLIPVLIKAIQEQQEIIDNQNTKIEGLTSELIELKSINTRVKVLEQQFKTLAQ